MYIITLSFWLFKTFSLFQHLLNPSFSASVHSGLAHTIQCNLQDEFIPTFYNFYGELNKFFFCNRIYFKQAILNDLSASSSVICSKLTYESRDIFVTSQVFFQNKNT